MIDPTKATNNNPSSNSPFSTVSNAADIMFSMFNITEGYSKEKLDKFCQGIGFCLTTLHEEAKNFAPATQADAGVFKQILQQANHFYAEWANPAVNGMQKFFEKGKHGAPSMYVKFYVLFGLSMQVPQAIKGVYNNMDTMNRKEQMEATLGCVLMLAGTGLVIASAVNPALNISVLGAIALTTLGCYLCRKALEQPMKDHPEDLPGWDILNIFQPLMLIFGREDLPMPDQLEDGIKENFGKKPTAKEEEEPISTDYINLDAPVTQRQLQALLKDVKALKKELKLKDEKIIVLEKEEKKRQAKKPPKDATFAPGVFWLLKGATKKISETASPALQAGRRFSRQMSSVDGFFGLTPRPKRHSDPTVVPLSLNPQQEQQPNTSRCWLS